MNSEYKSIIFLIILFLSNCVLYSYARKNSWDFDKGGADWAGDCKKGPQAPMDIAQPFTYRNMSMSFAYMDMMTPYRFGNDGNNLILEGDFGTVTYNGVTFFSSQILFYSPSMHTFSNKRLPLEMQILHNDAKGNLLSLSILFRKSKGDYSLILGKLGFDSPDLKRQEPLKPKTSRGGINLSKYVTDGKDFFVYEAKESLPPCSKNSTYLILTDVLKVSELQLENFPKLILNKNRIVQPRNDRKIFVTFRQEEIEAKKQEVRAKVKANDKVKMENNVINKIQEEKSKQNSQGVVNSNITDITSKYNQSSPEYQQIQNELLRIAKIKNDTLNNRTKEDECKDKGVIPFELVKEQAKAYDEDIKKDDPKLITNPPHPQDTMVIDRDLPANDLEQKRAAIEEQYLLWKELKNSNATLNNTRVFLQVKMIEKFLEDTKFKPYLKDKKKLNKNKDKSQEVFLSFVQLKKDDYYKKLEESEHALDELFRDADTYQDLKLLQGKDERNHKHTVLTQEEEKIGNTIINAKDGDIDKIINSFIEEMQAETKKVRGERVLVPVHNVENSSNSNDTFIVEVLNIENIENIESNDNSTLNAVFPLDSRNVDIKEVTLTDEQTQILQKEIEDKLRKYEQLKSIYENSSLPNGTDQVKKINAVDALQYLKNKAGRNKMKKSADKEGDKEIASTPNSEILSSSNSTILEIIHQVITNLINEFKHLDEINNKLYHKNNETNYLSMEGYLRITTKNLGLLIRASINYFQENNTGVVTQEQKMNKLNDLASKTLASQNRIINQNNPYKEVSTEEISPEDVNSILEEIKINITPNNSTDGEMKALVLEILVRLPVVLLKGDDSNIGNLNIGNLNSANEEEDVFITSSNAGKIKQTEILGPKTAEEKGDQLLPPPGQGKKASTREGVIDKTEIFNTYTWPETCKSGNQSPVNINKPYVPEELKLTLNFSAPKKNIALNNDGYAITLTADFFGYVQHGVHKYFCKEIRIHHPSEHTFGDDEVRSPMELQVVCQDMFSNTVVVSILFKLSDNPNEFLKALGFGWDNPMMSSQLRNNVKINLDENHVASKLDLGPFVNNVKHYVTYTGSLTSPPCKQNVQWFILLTKLEVTSKQIEYFPILFGRETNIRGLQELNNRKLKII